jgi:hypothetical protein
MVEQRRELMIHCPDGRTKTIALDRERIMSR